MASNVDVAVSGFVAATPARVRRIMFDPLQDPSWMAAVKTVQALEQEPGTGARVRRTGRFLGRPLRWTTEITRLSHHSLDLRIIDGPMRGTVAYRIEPDRNGSRVTIRNIGEAPGFAPRWLLTFMMRRSLAADLRRLRQVVERGS
jgi:uncharacterized membrane protein